MRQPITSASFFVGVQREGLISFGSGQPDLSPPEQAFAIYEKAPKIFRYGLIRGELALREALAKEWEGTPDQFVVTNGASEALDLVFRVLARRMKKKKVLLPRPYYYSYVPIIQFAGLEVVFTDLIDGKMNLDDVREKIIDCGAFLLNSPSNPTGRTQTPETIKAIEQITKEAGASLVSDEVYKDLIYDGEHYSPRGHHVITLDSFSKTFALCGLRVGYLYSTDQHIVNDIIEMKVHTSMNTNLLAQEMALGALQTPKEFLERQKAIWQQRRDVIYEGLHQMGFDLWKPEGAFYVFPKVKDPAKMVSDLFYDHKVIVYDGTWFGAPDRIRLSYALDMEKIHEGLRRIGEYLDA